MKYVTTLLSLLSISLCTAMDNPDAIAPEQHISLLQSFLLATDFKVAKNNKVTYPHYKDNTRQFSQARQDATVLLWKAHEKDRENDKNVSKLIMELYYGLDHTQTYEPQITDDNKLSLQVFMFRTFLHHKDRDINDDIVITPNGMQTVVTAQQKRTIAEFRQSLENFLMQLSSEDKITKTPRVPSLDLTSQFCLEEYLASRFATMEALPPELLAAFRRSVMKD